MTEVDDSSTSNSSDHSDSSDSSNSIMSSEEEEVVAKKPKKKSSEDSDDHADEDKKKKKKKKRDKDKKSKKEKKERKEKKKKDKKEKKAKKEAKDEKKSKKDKKKKDDKKAKQEKKKKQKKDKKKKKAESGASSSDSDASLDAQEVDTPPSTKLGATGNSNSSNKYLGITGEQKSVDGTASRIATIDPTSPALPKLNRPALPQFDETPDWMFKPSEDKLTKFGALGISGRLAEERRNEKQRSKLGLGSGSAVSSESKAYAQSFMKTLGVDARMKLLLDGCSTPVEKLRRLLSHDPFEKNYDDEVSRKFLSKNKELCSEKYEFEITKDEIYPLSMLAALGASDSTLKVCYKAYPDALLENDKWIGTPLHYACAYRAPKATLKFLHAKDDDEEMIESLNQRQRLPIHLACMLKTPIENLEFLIKENKQSLSKKDVDGMTPLHFACNRTDPQLEVIELLTSKYKKACIMQNNNGCTPLQLAVQRCTPLNILECLLIANDEVLSIPDNNGNLPLHTALHVNADKKIIQFVVWNNTKGLSHYNEKEERPIDMARRIYKKDVDLHEILEPE